jgi:hypothetical protein
MRLHRAHGYARNAVLAVLAATTTVVGVLVGATAASAHANYVTGVPVCTTTGTTANWVITWTIVNDYPETNTATITAATPGSVADVAPTSVVIGATANYPTLPVATGTVIQTLPGTDTGIASITVHGSWSPDDYQSSPDALGLTTLPNVCKSPLQLTTVPSSISPAYGTPVDDVATLTEGNSVAPTGVVTFYLCGPEQSAATCSSSGALLGTGAITSDAGTYVATSPTVTPTTPGTYCFAASYRGDANYLSEDDISGTGECFTVAPATPGFVTTAASAAPALGTADFDTAVVTGVPGGTAPTGTVTFYICHSAACTTGGTALPGVNVYSTVGNVLTVTSPTFTPGNSGTYCFYAAYSGDLRYADVPLESSAGSNECFTVTPAGSTITTTPAHSTVVLGGTNSDTITVVGVGSVVPTGTASFYECAETTAGTPCTTGGSTVGTAVALAPVSGSSPATATATSSAVVTPTSAGTYCFYATYSGDSNYAGGTETNPAGECFTVTPAGSTITSHPNTASIQQGGTDADVVTVSGLSGGPVPTGTVTFYECGPGATSCTATSGAAFGTGPVVLTAAGTTASATSATFVPPVAGTYCFDAVYSGDRNYGSGADGSSDECFAVSAATAVVPPSTAATVSTQTVPTTVAKKAIKAIAKTNAPPTQVLQATTPHTGEPWSGDTPYEVLVLALGLALCVMGWRSGRRRLGPGDS